jgi:hypothetical protein
MTINFSGAILRKVERDNKGGKLHFSAELTAGVSKAMKWEDLPDSCTGGKMEGAINAGALSLSPKQKDLFSDSELSADFQSVGHFEIVRLELEKSKGKGFRRELRFHVVFIAPGVAALAESWLMSVGDGKSSMRVTGTIAESGGDEEESNVTEMKA